MAPRGCTVRFPDPHVQRTPSTGIPFTASASSFAQLLRRPGACARVLFQGRVPHVVCESGARACRRWGHALLTGDAGARTFKKRRATSLGLSRPAPSVQAQALGSMHAEGRDTDEAGRLH